MENRTRFDAFDLLGSHFRVHDVFIQEFWVNFGVDPGSSLLFPFANSFRSQTQWKVL